MRANLNEYAKRYSSFAHLSRQDGILEVRLHTNDGPSIFDGAMHAGLGDLFGDIGSDRETRIIILTATGDRFLKATDMDVKAMEPFLPYTAALHLPLMPESHRLIENFLNIEVPVISAVNGPASVHAEIPVLADVVLASEDSYFSDSFHFINGIVPGDGVQVIWPMLMGLSRARYFLITGEHISAADAKAIGFVNEVLPAANLMERARSIARAMLRQPDVTLRATRFLFTRALKQAIGNDLSVGLALEGLGNSNHWPLQLVKD
jgi:enoyl-CoA hydratase/carnithine racemase